MRIATLNIGGPSLDRSTRIAAYLQALDADVLVLTETRGSDGTRSLLNYFRARGERVLGHLPGDSGERGVVVVARSGKLVSTSPLMSDDLAHRLVAVNVDGSDPLTIVGAYVPSRDASPAKILRKRRFLAETTSVLDRWANGRLVFIGDLNIVSRSHIPRFSAFRAWEYEAMESWERSGLLDAYSQRHPERQVHSWIGRSGAGYKYDYAFVSPDLAPNVVDCVYDHQTRVLGVSDHAAVILDLDPWTTGRDPRRLSARVELTTV